MNRNSASNTPTARDVDVVPVERDLRPESTVRVVSRVLGASANRTYPLDSSYASARATNDSPSRARRPSPVLAPIPLPRRDSAPPRGVARPVATSTRRRIAVARSPSYAHGATNRSASSFCEDTHDERRAIARVQVPAVLADAIRARADRGRRRRRRRTRRRRPSARARRARGERDRRRRSAASGARARRDRGARRRTSTSTSTRARASGRRRARARATWSARCDARRRRVAKTTTKRRGGGAPRELILN